MKRIDNLTVTVTYTVGLSDVDVPDNVFDALAQCYDKGGEVPGADECLFKGNEKLACAWEWLANNISESDAMELEYEIDCFDEN